MGISLNQAAKQAKVAKSTLQVALKSGECKGVQNEKGQWDIDASSLAQWLSNRTPKPRDDQLENRFEHPEKPPKTSEVPPELRSLKEAHARERALLESQLRETREDRDKWQLAFERQQETAANALRVIEDLRQKEAEKPSQGRFARAWAVLTGSA